MKILLAGALLASLAISSSAEEPKPAPNRPDRPNWEQFREELSNLPPEERQARIREMRERFGQSQGQPVERPFVGQGRAQMPAVAGGAVGRVMAVLTPEQRESMRQLTE